ncbi:energy coupling factor transporter S component ThiW [Candidatus Borrarchaeum sp.]|uniref:energy coupling factor transporter S component ThiW n=1 Tax=Candidatus Borrarchaeum sp. TaxID=2846742 RepID=UPI00257A639F|nr:energy coupling factor transporter S component ThiW [Candidatus Borrarchaeum sp.]
MERGLQKNKYTEVVETKKIALSAVLIALGVLLASFLWFPIGPTKVFPGQHIVNAIAGILLGPLYAVFIALVIGIIRNSLGWGTIFAFPGGLPGGFVVGIIYKYLKKTDYAALAEPLGTVIIGATISALIFAPLIGATPNITFFWIAFAASCIPGSVLGFIILKILRKSGILDEFLEE